MAIFTVPLLIGTAIAGTGLIFGGSKRGSPLRAIGDTVGGGLSSAIEFLSGWNPMEAGEKYNIEKAFKNVDVKGMIPDIPKIPNPFKNVTEKPKEIFTDLTDKIKDVATPFQGITERVTSTITNNEIPKAVGGLIGVPSIIIPKINTGNIMPNAQLQSTANKGQSMLPLILAGVGIYMVTKNAK